MRTLPSYGSCEKQKVYPASKQKAHHGAEQVIAEKKKDGFAGFTLDFDCSLYVIHSPHGKLDPRSDPSVGCGGAAQRKGKTLAI